MTNEAVTATTGRPRDPDLERRAMQSALDVYARLGWSGFNFGKVASEAHVGKSSLYSRWATPRDLLVEAFDAFDTFYQKEYDALSGLPFAERVRRMIQHRLRTYFTPGGLAIIRVHLEYQADPEAMTEVWDRSVGLAVLRTRTLVQHAIRDGDLLPETSLVHLADALEGAMVMHAIATPVALRQRTIDRLDAYAAEMAERTLGPWLTEKAQQECEYCRLNLSMEAPMVPDPYVDPDLI